MEPEDARRLLQQGDPLRDGAEISVRLLAIDEAEEIRGALRDAGIACQLRLVKPGEVHAGYRGPESWKPSLESEYSVLRPSWNVVVPVADLDRAQALAEEKLRTELDGRQETAAVEAGEQPAPGPVALLVVPWDQAWELVERLGRNGVRAAVGAPPGSLPIEQQSAQVLVLPEDVERARAVLPPGSAGP